MIFLLTEIEIAESCFDRTCSRILYMANLKASKKDVRRIKRRRERNIPQRSRIRNLGKRVYTLIAEGELEEARKFLPIYYRFLDRAGRKNLIHPRRAYRYKSRAAKLLHQAEKTEKEEKSAA